MATRESGPENPARNTGSTSTHRRATRRSTLEAPMTSSDLVNSLCCCPTKWRAGSAAKPVAVGARRGREGPPGKAGSSARDTTPILPLLGNFSGTLAPPRGISRPPMIRAKKRPGSSTGQSGEIAPSTVPLPVERLMTSPPFALPDFSSVPLRSQLIVFLLMIVNFPHAQQPKLFPLLRFCPIFVHPLQSRPVFSFSSADRNHQTHTKRPWPVRHQAGRATVAQTPLEILRRQAPSFTYLPG